LIATRGGRQLSIRLRRDGDRRLLLLEEQAGTSPAERLSRLGLSSRQAEVLRWVASGKNDKEVALILGLSERTVQHHLEQVYRTLGVENRTAEARIAIGAAERPVPD
jgi:DNA-binding CsgD family transcriptional regulator